MLAMLLALMLAGGAAQDDGWIDVAGGRRHVATGLTCPAQAGNLRLGTVTGDATKATCRYKYHCPEPGACGNATAFASVSIDPSMDFGAQIRSLAKQQGLGEVTPGSPASGATAKFSASGGKGENASQACWWQAGKVDIGALWNVGAGSDVAALVAAVVAANGG